jgi:hypothetical protein
MQFDDYPTPRNKPLNAPRPARLRPEAQCSRSQTPARQLHAGCGRGLGVGGVLHHHHANAVVEGAVHFMVANASGSLQPGKQLGLRPAALDQVLGQALGQHAGNVL